VVVYGKLRKVWFPMLERAKFRPMERLLNKGFLTSVNKIDVVFCFQLKDSLIRSRNNLYVGC